ncbi:MAG: thiamine diphosphokinase [Lachnospiraceae bacterium]|nr:thiamine diphosphokinase [Lachnospiraceae bacterium]
MKQALIISGGAYDVPPVALQPNLIIACDKGYRYAQMLGLKPDIVLGDFDSIDERPTADGFTLLTYPIEKDDTDTMLAIKYALGKGCDQITLLCALGNRLDHTYANIQSMHYAAQHGACCEILSKKEQLRALRPGSYQLKYKPDTSLSLFALTDSCKALTIHGAKYDVERIELKNSFPLGLGNSWLSDTVSITFEEGILLVAESYMGDES